MSEPQQILDQRKPQTNIHWPSVGLFTLSALTILYGWGSAAVQASGALYQLVGRTVDFETLSLNLNSLFTGLLIGILALPSAVYSLARIMGKTLKLKGKWKSIRQVLHPRWLILVYPLVVLAGYFANQNEDLYWFLLPFFHVMALAIPPIWVAWVGFRKLRTSSPQRAWGVFNIGLTVGPVFIVIFELLIIIVFLLTAAVILFMNPDVMEALRTFTESYAYQHQFVGPDDLEPLSPILNSPNFLFGLLTYMSVLVPIIEESFKPIGVLFLIHRKITPREGFVAGVISGAGFAMFENLQISIVRSDWLVQVLGRLGTSLMHIFTAGIIGYTLALAWKEKRYILLGASYLLGIIIHGLWNAAAVASTFATFQHEGAFLPPSFEDIGWGALIALALMALLGLVLINRKLRKTIPLLNNEG